MIKAELRSENTFCFTINASIFNERVLTKALYWYAESFIIYWNKNKDNLFEITLELKPSANKIYTFEYVTHKFNQDLIDYKNGSSSNLVVISFLFQLSSSFLILLKVVDMFAF